ncbi:hypothetical protein ACIF70_26485 [Actinacidiphila glaucinigra]|uniref:hypothetical protein n=1 Tax=Actinacidiphila glaucinigra TaxID=235986 RepID=UPI0037CCA541
MPIPRRSAAEALSRTLRRHGAAPDAVSDVGAAWEAFAEFLAVEVEGVEEADGDGFIAEWGRWDWNDDLPALSFGRLLAVRDTGGDAAHRQPEYWKVELQLCFAEDPAWAELHDLGLPDTGFDHHAIGAPRTAALAETLRLIQSCPQLAAMWRATPVRSAVTLERAG